MNELLEAAKLVTQLLDSMHLPHCLIGGLAVNRWGRIRATQDVDFSVFVEFGQEETVCRNVLDELTPRIEDSVEFAIINRVLLAQTNTGVPVDLGLAAFPFEESLIARATLFEFDTDIVIPTVSAEDLIVLKAIANRGHDWRDIEGIIVRQSQALDWTLVIELLSSLSDLIPEHDPLIQLTQMRDRLLREESHD